MRRTRNFFASSSAEVISTSVRMKEAKLTPIRPERTDFRGGIVRDLKLSRTVADQPLQYSVIEN